MNYIPFACDAAPVLVMRCGECERIELLTDYESFRYVLHCPVCGYDMRWGRIMSLAEVEATRE